MNNRLLGSEQRGSPFRHDPYEFVLSGYQFINHGCVECCVHAALFVFAGHFVSLCPKCAADRIGELRRAGYSLTEDLEILEDEARREVLHQERKEREALQVRWDDLVRCHGCGKVIQLDHARYREDKRDSCRLLPCCLNCYTDWSAGFGPGPPAASPGLH